MTMSYKQHYRQFLKYHSETLHFAPHSHHYWPDVTQQAQLSFWEDSARGADNKWFKIFSERVPEVQKRLAELLHHPYPEQFAFANNTHELLYRVISCFDPAKPLNILSTDSEFHSFSRQIRRLQERSNVTVTSVATEPFESFPKRWQEAIEQDSYDLIFTSQVFYNSGVVAPALDTWVAKVNPDTTIVVDGYHGCGAVPTDLSSYAERVFYIAGSYKYLQAGEGCCFMAVPKGCTLRPEYTGWFADFANLAKPQQGRVEYADDGFRFAGATMDFTALYRLLSVLRWWQEDGLTVARMHSYVQTLQQAFLELLDDCSHPLLNRQRLLVDDLDNHGHFLTFRLDSAEQVSHVADVLAKAGIETDYRGDRLRFGFAIYHDKKDYERLKKAVSLI